jgi:hypothetical protein
MNRELYLSQGCCSVGIFKEDNYRVLFVPIPIPSPTSSVPAGVYFLIRPHTRRQITIDLRPALLLVKLQYYSPVQVFLHFIK